MKIKGISGEFAFRALVRRYGPDDSWKLTESYFFEKPPCPGDREIKWPIEVYEDGSIYVPSEDECNDK